MKLVSSEELVVWAGALTARLQRQDMMYVNDPTTGKRKLENDDYVLDQAASVADATTVADLVIEEFRKRI